MTVHPIIGGFIFVVMAVLVFGFGVSPRTAGIIACVSFFPAMYLFGVLRIRRRERDDRLRRRQRFQ